MSDPRVYRAVPLTSLGKVRGEVTIRADSAAAALGLAEAALGEGTAFDLCEGTAVVLSHRPARAWRSLGRDEDPGQPLAPASG